MGANTLFTALLNILQKNVTLDSEFSLALTGTATSAGTSITGIGTLFGTEVLSGDYIGKPANGYRQVMAVTDATHCIVELAFDVALSGEAIKRTEIKPGFKDIEEISRSGKILRLLFKTAGDLDLEAARALGLSGSPQRTYAVYGFMLIVAFIEPNVCRAEFKKCNYDKILKDILDLNLSLGVPTCIGITEIGDLVFAEDKEINLYFAPLPLIFYEQVQRGSR